MIYGPATGARSRRLEGEDLLAAARLYAGMDLSKAKRAGAIPVDEGRSLEILSGLYGRVFAGPERVEARLHLAAEQAALRLATDALYHLDQADRIRLRPIEPEIEGRPREPASPTAEDGRQAARIALLRAVVHAQKGDSQEALTQLNRARSLDPEILNREDLEAYRIEESQIRRIRPDVEIAPARVRR